MPSLIIRHVTLYRFRQPVAFGEHRMMLRPRDSHDQRVIETSLEISPEPRSLCFVQDAFGNHVGIAQFSGRSTELWFKSTVCLEHSSANASDVDLEDFVSANAQTMQDLGNRLVAKARLALGLEQYDAARSWLGEAGAIGFSSPESNSVLHDLEAAAASSTAIASLPSMHADGMP